MSPSGPKTCACTIATSSPASADERRSTSCRRVFRQRRVRSAPAEPRRDRHLHEQPARRLRVAQRPRLDPLVQRRAHDQGEQGGREQAEPAELPQQGHAGRHHPLIGRSTEVFESLVPTLGSGARGRHDPSRRQPDPPGARRACPGRAAHAASALRPGRVGGAAGGPRRRVGGRPRQAPVPALRGRPDDPLAPAHDRLLARARARAALAPLRPRGVAGRCAAATARSCSSTAPCWS